MPNTLVDLNNINNGLISSNIVPKRAFKTATWVGRKSLGKLRNNDFLKLVNGPINELDATIPAYT